MPQTTNLQKPCVGYYDKERHLRVSCGKLCARSRCDEHEARYQATRRPPARERGYDAQYGRDRKKLLAPDPRTGERVMCELQLDGCTVWADTADHDDPLLGGKNVAARRGHLTPACSHCNSKRGSKPVLSVYPATERRRLEAARDVTRDDHVTASRVDDRSEQGVDRETLMPDGSVR